ncbi:MAG: hypothetical protein ACR2IG_02350 [Roseomonas sp.]
MSTYRKAKFGPDGFYELPKVEFTAQEIAEIMKEIMKKVKPPKKSSEDAWHVGFPDFLQEMARWYVIVASQLKEAPTNKQLEDYVEKLNDALERLYLALGADRKGGLVAHVSSFGAGKPHVRNMIFNPKWDAYQELMALGALPEMRNRKDWFNATANLAPEVIADITAKGQLQLSESRGLLDDQHTLARALAGVDALAAIARSGQAAVASLPKSRGGRPSRQEEQAFLFKKLAVLFRKTYDGEEPKSTRSGDEFKGTWHDWLDVLLPKIIAKLKNLGLKEDQVPGDTWNREAAHAWLKEAERHLKSRGCP